MIPEAGSTCFGGGLAAASAGGFSGRTAWFLYWGGEFIQSCHPEHCFRACWGTLSQNAMNPNLISVPPQLYGRPCTDVHTVVRTDVHAVVRTRRVRRSVRISVRRRVRRSVQTPVRTSLREDARWMLGCASLFRFHLPCSTCGPKMEQGRSDTRDAFLILAHPRRIHVFQA